MSLINVLTSRVFLVDIIVIILKNLSKICRLGRIHLLWLLSGSFWTWVTFEIIINSTYWGKHILGYDIRLLPLRFSPVELGVIATVAILGALVSRLLLDHIADDFLALSVG